MDSLDAACIALNLTDEQCTIIREAAEELCKEKRQKGKREPSPYQQFIAKCMKEKNIKKFEEASSAMKECVKQWKTEKKE
jgi:TRAP-type C4-dicarboxylate transport system substrate-binding protein